MLFSEGCLFQVLPDRVFSTQASIMMQKSTLPYDLMQRLISSLAKILDFALPIGHFMVQNLAQLMVQLTLV
jgi:hypothetical protein